MTIIHTFCLVYTTCSKNQVNLECLGLCNYVSVLRGKSSGRQPITDSVGGPVSPIDVHHDRGKGEYISYCTVNVAVE